MICYECLSFPIFVIDIMLTDLSGSLVSDADVPLLIELNPPNPKPSTGYHPWLEINSVFNCSLQYLLNKLTRFGFLSSLPTLAELCEQMCRDLFIQILCCGIDLMYYTSSSHLREKGVI